MDLLWNQWNGVSHFVLAVIVSIILILIILYVTFDYLKSVIMSFQLKGPPARFLLGNAMLLIDKHILQKSFTAVERSYGRIFRFWVGIIPYIVITNPKDVQTVLSSGKHTEKVFLYKLLRNYLGNGLVTSAVEEWSVHRRLLQPLFHVNALERFLGTFNHASNVLLRRLKDSPSQLNIVHLVNSCVLDILKESLLGIPISIENNIDLDADENSSFRQSSPAGLARTVKPWLLLNCIYKWTNAASFEAEQKQKQAEFIRMMIAKRLAANRNGDSSNCECLLDAMLDISKNHTNFTIGDIVNEISTFMMAGQDSVSGATAFCLFLLAQHPDRQQKCMDELNGIFGVDGAADRMPTMRDINRMRYLEQCVKETLRLYPSVPIFARQTTEEIQCDKYTIPRGCSIFISPYATHRLASIYPDPERFDPDRFAPEQCERRHPCAFIPFSAGPRNCIGYKFAYIEIKAIVSTILREFELLPVPGKTEIKHVFRVTVRASGGLHIRLKPRKQRVN